MWISNSCPHPLFCAGEKHITGVGLPVWREIGSPSSPCFLCGHRCWALGAATGLAIMPLENGYGLNQAPGTGEQWGDRVTAETLQSRGCFFVLHGSCRSFVLRERQPKEMKIPGDLVWARRLLAARLTVFPSLSKKPKIPTYCLFLTSHPSVLEKVCPAVVQQWERMRPGRLACLGLPGTHWYRQTPGYPMEKNLA